MMFLFENATKTYFYKILIQARTSKTKSLMLETL